MIPMDEQYPPRPVISRATQAQQSVRSVPPPPASARATTSPIGAAIGCLAAGAWFIGFARWFGLSGWISWVVAGLGGLLVGLGLLLTGTSITDIHKRRNG